MVCRTDPALPVIDIVRASLLTLFADDDCPPRIGSTETVRLFAGDTAPIAAWDAHTATRGGCKEPFAWLRVTNRYRSQTFPSPSISSASCELPKVLRLEIGVAWCAYIPDADRINWAEYAREADDSLDTSWRIEEALCLAATSLRKQNHTVGTDTLIPYGPEGDVISWSGILYVSY